MKQAAYRIAIVAVLLGLAAAPAAELDGFQDLDRLQDADLPMAVTIRDKKLSEVFSMLESFSGVSIRFEVTTDPLIVIDARTTFKEVLKLLAAARDLTYESRRIARLGDWSGSHRHTSLWVHRRPSWRPPWVRILQQLLWRPLQVLLRPS